MLSLSGLRCRIIATSAVFFLTACGGGGGSNTASSSPSVSTFDIVSTLPSNFSINVDTDPLMLVQFNDDVFTPSVDQDSFQLLRNGSPIAGAISFNNNEINFSVDDDLSLLATYNLRVTTAISNLAGDPLLVDPVEGFEWIFSTRDGVWEEQASFASSSASGVISDPITAVDGDNATWTFYRRDNVFSGHNDIFAKRLLSDNSWGAAQLISNRSNDEGVTSLPQLAVLNNGDLLVLWEEYGVVPLPTQLSYNRYNLASGSWGDAQLINSNAIMHMNPQLVAGANGGVMAVYESAASGPTNIAAIFYDMDNDQWTSASYLDITFIPLDQDAGSPRIAIDSQDNAMAVWLQDDRVYSRFYNAADAIWEEPIAINDLTAGPLQPGLALLVDAQDNFTSLWAQEDQALGFSFIRSNRFTADQAWSGAELISGSALGFSPQAVVDSQGDVVVIWEQAPALGNNNLLSSRLDNSTQDWSPPILLENNDQAASAPQIIIDASDNAMVIWQQNRSGTFFDLNNNIAIDPPAIWVSRYSQISMEWLAPTVISTIVDAAERPVISNNQQGEIMAAWMQQNDGQFTLESRRFD